MSNISIVDGKLKLKDTDMGGAFVAGAGELFSDSLIQLHNDKSYPEGAFAANTITEDDKDIVSKAIVSEPDSIVELLDDGSKKNAYGQSLGIYSAADGKSAGVIKLIGDAATETGNALWELTKGVAEEIDEFSDYMLLPSPAAVVGKGLMKSCASRYEM